MKPEIVTRDAVYPESPRWRDGLLWFSDVHDYAVKTVDARGQVRLVTRVPGRPAGLGFLPDGRLLVAAALSRTLHMWDGKMLTDLVDLSRVAAGLLNDMVVDARGRAFVGDTGFNLMGGQAERPGQLIMVDAAEPGPAAIRVVADDVMFPNGVAVTPEGGRLWLAESARDRVSVFSVAEDGSLARTASFAVPDFPDGLCIDDAGGAWVASLKAGVFRHLTGSGAVDRVITMADQLAVACTLGGPDRRTLYLCSAETTMADLARGVSVGRISIVRVADAGTGAP